MKHKQIILAEDDQAIVEVVSSILADNDFDVIAVRNRKELFKAISTTTPSVVLLDISLQDADGRELLKELKTKKHDVPVVLLSANSDIAGIAQTLGANDFLAKPFDIDDLIRIVRKYQ